MDCRQNLMRIGRGIMLHLRQRLGDTKLLVHILVVVFATSSWVDMNGLWVELPLLVLEAPEKWDLPSYITIISQVANVGPLLFVGLAIVIPHSKPNLEKITSFIIILVGVVSALLLAFFWQSTSVLGGVEHSTALLILNFFLAVGDCTSSVCYYAFMSLLKPQYMASLLLGESMSGMLPAMIALGQGAGDIVCVNTSHKINHTLPNGTTYNTTTYSLYPQYVKPNFSVQVFFLTLASILFMSGIAFILINFLPYCQSEMVHHVSQEYERLVPEKLESTHLENSVQDYGSNQTLPKDSSSTVNGHENIFQQNSSEQNPTASSLLPSTGINGNMPWYKFGIALSIIVIINMTLTTFLSTIGIYSILPYGLQAYHLETTLTPIANSIACFIAVLYLSTNLGVISVMTLLGLGCVGFIIYLAVSSPTPILYDEEIGAVLAVGIWIIVTLLLIYAKVCLAGVMRQCGRKALISAGVATQAGSLIGATVGFCMTQYTNVFKSASYC